MAEPSQPRALGSGIRRRIKGPGFRERSVLAARTRVGPWGGIALSLAAHLVVFGGALAWAHWTPPRVVPPKPIVARLVRLGKPRDEKLLPRLPAPPPPAPPPPSAPPPAAPVAAAPAPAPSAGIAPAKSAESEAPDAQAKAALERQKRMMEALQRLGPPPAGPTGKVAEPLPGRPDGDPEGDAEEAAEGDRYLGLVVQAIKRAYVVPNAIPQKERMLLSCKLRLFVHADGKIERFVIEGSSGNPLFDRAVEASLQRAVLPPPPPVVAAVWARSGMGFEFKP